MDRQMDGGDYNRLFAFLKKNGDIKILASLCYSQRGPCIKNTFDKIYIISQRQLNCVCRSYQEVSCSVQGAQICLLVQVSLSYNVIIKYSK